MTTDQILEKMNSLVWKLFDFHEDSSAENEAAAEKAAEEVRKSLDENSSDALRALADSLDELFLEMTD